MHLLGDQSRGYVLELLLAKILFCGGPALQVLATSAPLPNLPDLARWLRSSLYTTDYKPVPVTELVLVGDRLLNSDLVLVCTVEPSLDLPLDTDHLAWLCLQAVLEDHPVLLFCPTRVGAEKLAETLAQVQLYVKISNQ